MRDTDTAQVERMLAELALALDMHDLLETLHPDVKDGNTLTANDQANDNHTRNT